MMSPKWRWAGAREIGTSHLANGNPCQDFGAAIELCSSDSSTFIAVVSDGAGSASHAHLGSKIVTTSFLRSASSFLKENRLSDLTETVAWTWLDAIRDHISLRAERNSLTPRDFASTIVALIADEEQARILHVGDGAAVVRAVNSAEWEVPSWPYQGEYAATTTFVTDEPQPRLNFVEYNTPIDSFAVFSDGIERMVLDYAAKTAHPPFFNRMIAPVKDSTALGQDHHLSKSLQSYLSSEAVCIRTDDDKTLILGSRI